jgi:hypothetical protein
MTTSDLICGLIFAFWIFVLGVMSAVEKSREEER